MGNKTSGAEYPSGRYLRSQRNYSILKKEERGEELGGDGSQREEGRSTKEVEREEWKKEWKHLGENGIEKKRKRT